MDPSNAPVLSVSADEHQPFRPLLKELEQWRIEGRNCPMWWRDDDLVSNSPALRTLAKMAERTATPVLMSVIPGAADPALAGDTASMTRLSFCQHGFQHCNHEPPDTPTSEFGMARSLDAVEADLHAGYDVMVRLFGDRFLPIFVPPWNRLRADAVPALRQLGIRGVSQYHGIALDAQQDMPVVNAHVDILQWTARPPVHCQPVDELVERLVELLQVHRAGTAPPPPLGILTHHRVMRDDAWTFMTRLLDVTKAFECVQWLSAEHLFRA